MVPEAEVHTRHHGTRHEWVNLALGISAMVVSVVSVVIAVRHGETMERMAEANARLVAANSWPFLQYSTGNQDEHGRPRLRLSVVNVGVGPARVESLEVWWHGRPVASPNALLEACCGLAPGAPAPPMEQDLVVGRILRAGEASSFLELAQTEATAGVWARLNLERLHVKFRACFCSVFDECWQSTLVGTRATRVSSCPVPAVPFSIPGAEDLEH